MAIVSYPVTLIMQAPDLPGQPELWLGRRFIFGFAPFFGAMVYLKTASDDDTLCLKVSSVEAHEEPGKEMSATYVVAFPVDVKMTSGEFLPSGWRHGMNRHEAIAHGSLFGLAPLAPAEVEESLPST